ncbi:uncharacterized protein B0J16DRAFT_412439 [Fusarium flagelliforme]|uniref:uncharacterized protein n=1 Tax=Fusarium flagelliforme TaxID=2675880 RepID=UPI001E8DB171|nr:uncharacterized protein B0J16DRAFT_412439 [Fusarium flagelliforme]KAH7193875.1 hypothetical protein B0J16DRAFT_412439 [Fusarium flagelliforme]
MASNNRFQPSGRHVHVAGENYRSTSPSRPVSPGPIDETASDYFNPISQAPSQTSLSRYPSQNPSQASLSAFPSYQDPTSINTAYNQQNPPPARRRPPVDQARQPSIRIRRSSNGSVYSNYSFDGFSDDGRPRSVSQPERARTHDGPALARHSRRVPQAAMPRLTEEGGRPSMAELGISDDDRAMSPSASLPDDAIRPKQGRFRRASRFFWPGNHRRQADNDTMAVPMRNRDDNPNPDDEYDQNLVDWLDVIDPEVQTLSTLTNVQNSLFVPDLGKWVNRRPTYALSRHDPQAEWARGAAAEERRREAAQGDRAQEPAVPETINEDPPPMQRSSTITSRLTDSHYAALPHGTTLEGWTPEEKAELDDHVRHMLHSRRARFKRRMKGFGQYVRRPLGFLVTLYATLITLFGLAWVLFLIGWIYVGDKQSYLVHIIDSVLVALFAIMGDGLAPFRAVDTYHMFFIWRLSRLIKRAEEGKKPRNRLQKKRVPKGVATNIEDSHLTGHQARVLLDAQNYNPERDGTLATEQQVPEVQPESPEEIDLEHAKTNGPESDQPALTFAQFKKLQHHQKKMAKSHSFYKPHETFTHFAFPQSYLIAIVILLDCHSCLQISLGACTWGIDYHTRPFAITTVILCVSITCNITAGLLISRGDRKTRKKDVWELLDRQELTQDAIKHMEKKKQEEEKEEREKEEKERKKEEKEEKERQSMSLDRDGEIPSVSKELKKLVKSPSK